MSAWVLYPLIWVALSVAVAAWLGWAQVKAERVRGTRVRRRPGAVPY